MESSTDKPGCDCTLGLQVRNRLIAYGVETPISREAGDVNLDYADLDYLEDKIYSIMSVCLQLDMRDPSIKNTPKRVAKMYTQEVFRGLDYTNFPACTTIPNTMKVDEIVCCKGISVWSMCEHHLIPFTGFAAVGYIPKEKILGLSKFNRIVDFFSRRPQVQERLTEQIYRALQCILDTEDVAVVIDATHHCVRLRGVKDVGSGTVTSKMGGRFMSKPEARAEFFQLARG
jgi:GTP cyclohydrolase I